MRVRPGLTFFGEDARKRNAGPGQSEGRPRFAGCANGGANIALREQCVETILSLSLKTKAGGKLAPPSSEAKRPS